MVKIMVAGAASGYTDGQVELARILGLTIAKANCILVNGACTGLPWEAAEAARSAGGRIIAVSPASSLDEHTSHFGFPQYPTEEMLFAGREADTTWSLLVHASLPRGQVDKERDLKKQFQLKFRNTVSVAIADAVIAIGGRIGTINELTIASDMAKPIGIVEKGGGTAELFPELVRQSGKQKALILVLLPTELVDQILHILEV